jgi:IS1 family transposase
MEEKEKFIADAWKDYGDDIIAYVDGEGSMEEFIALPNNVQELVVIEAIKANFCGIFDKPYDEGLNTEN